ncbi:class I SAM-dependent methyltransferase [Promicromonospora sukumoe]|uniref:class I SAM-dependent methyltransferase n=1 Tax=Promicromonospora sukumoe TaxID=88382 RepID=UPI003665223B
MDHSTVRITDPRTPEERGREFLPGMARPWLLPFYDAFTRLSRVRPLHDRAAALADVAPGESVLDLGCGTGNLSLAVLRAQPAARVTGLDPDAAALRVAARKASRRRVPLTLVQGFADRLPVDDGSLDHVVSALALHHVPDEARVRFGQEAYRALRPGGTVTIVDFGGADGASGADGGEGHGAHDTAHGGGHGSDGEHGHRHGRGRRRGPGSIGAYGRVRGHGRGHDRGGSEAAAQADHHTARPPAADLLRLLADAGFTDVREAERAEHRYGRLTFVQATRG